MKMIAGRASLACSNRSRTREAPTPTITSMNSDADRREERHAGLAGHGAGQQRLAGAGRPGQQHAARDAGAELGVLLRVTQEVDHLDQLVLGLVDPGHVLEGDRLSLGLHALGPRAAELADHTAAARALRRTAEQEHEQCHQQDRRAEREQDRGQQRAAARRLGGHHHVLLLEQRESSSSFAKVGTSVSKFSAVSSSKVTSFLNSPWTVSPVEAISLTLPSRTWLKNVGV